MKTTTDSKPTQRQSMIGEEPPFPCPAKAGRPSGYSPEKVTAACQLTEQTGVSDTAAAALAGVTKSSLSRWKQFDEEVQMLLTAARARYVLPRLRIIGETRLKDGQPDWRAQAWLIKFSDPETRWPWGARASRTPGSASRRVGETPCGRRTPLHVDRSAEHKLAGETPARACGTHALPMAACGGYRIVTDDDDEFQEPLAQTLDTSRAGNHHPTHASRHLLPWPARRTRPDRP